MFLEYFFCKMIGEKYLFLEHELTIRIMLPEIGWAQKKKKIGWEIKTVEVGFGLSVNITGSPIIIESIWS